MVECSRIGLQVMSFVKHSLHILRAKGYKITRPRKQILEVLEEAQRPFSPYEIQKIIRQQGGHLDSVTVYRVLDLLCALNLVHKVLSSGGFIKCVLGEEEGCHRYLVCRQCGILQEFADRALCLRENEAAEKLGFHAEHHLTEFSGLCFDCCRTAG